MTNSEAVEKLDSVSSLYLREILEPKNDFLKLIVEEAVEVGSDSANSASNASGSPLNCAPAESIQGCRRFELYWQSYVAYLVTAVGVGSNAHKGEVYTGRILRLYNKSRFLEHISRDFGAHRSELLHYGVVCLNHVVDVAAYTPPEVRVLIQPAERKRLAARHIGGIIGPY